MHHPISVTSEIGVLRTVLLHRPGREIENLIPEYLDKLLFDDIPYLPVMQKEHDTFARVLVNQGVEVLYLEQLLAEALRDEGARVEFITDVLRESHAGVGPSTHRIEQYLSELPIVQLVQVVMGGLRKDEVPGGGPRHLTDFVHDIYPFYLDPLPNLYFTRDPASVIGNGVCFNRMHWGARGRESLFMKTILGHHPRFAGRDIPVWFEGDGEFSMEGGDQLVLSDEVLLIGVSERTSAEAIEALALRLLYHEDLPSGESDGALGQALHGAQEQISHEAPGQLLREGLGQVSHDATGHASYQALGQASYGTSRMQKVVAIEIPKSRSFMHLDTVFTMVDVDKFTIHSEVLASDHSLGIYVLEADGVGGLNISTRDDLEATLRELLGLPEIDLIPCGGGDKIAASREQWNDGSNTLAVAPGVVLTYDRNYVSNQELRRHGVTVIEMAGSELGRGRGGPRCMSMPLFREPVQVKREGQNRGTELVGTELP